MEVNRDYFVEQFNLLEKIDERIRDGAGPVLEEPRVSLEARLQGWSKAPEVATWLGSVATLDLEFINEMEAAKLFDRATADDHRLALRVSSRLFSTSAEVEVQPVQPEASKPKLARVETRAGAAREKDALVEEFFNRPAKKVAEELKGKTLLRGTDRIVITHTQDQNSKENARHKDSPNFGPNRPDFFVIYTRGRNVMLFLRAGKPEDYSCVRIEGAKHYSTRLESANKVSAALNLTKPCSGNLVIDPDQPDVIQLVNVVSAQ